MIFEIMKKFQQKIFIKKKNIIHTARGMFEEFINFIYILDAHIKNEPKMK